MSDAPNAVVYGVATLGIGSFQHVRLSTRPFDETLGTLHREIEVAGL